LPEAWDKVLICMKKEILKFAEENTVEAAPAPMIAIFSVT
jgi:hypothetical protein